MKQLTTYIVRGKTTPEQILNEIKTFAKETKKDLEVVVSEVKDIRSSAQNKFLWSAVYPAFVEAGIGLGFEGWSNEDWHYKLTKMYLSQPHPKDPNMVITKSTTVLTVEEFSKYIDKCIEFLVAPVPEGLEGTIMERDRQVYEHSLGRK